MFYFVKTPFWIPYLYRKRTWKVNTTDKIIYLTFDDGPHPSVTPFVLELLEKFNAKATFFCIGDNVKKYPDVYKRIIDEGHSVGNHTMHHVNGWKTDDSTYLNDIAEAKNLIDSRLFRPPYGKITGFQQSQLCLPRFNLHTVMWTVLSGDFDNNIDKEQCLINVLRNTGPGSVVVFHDSEKAKEKMEFVLPQVLDYFSKRGFRFEKITL